MTLPNQEVNKHEGRTYRARNSRGGEGEAIARARHGDAGAFELPLQTHCRHVYAVCLRMIRNPAEAERFDSTSILAALSKDRHVPR